MTALPPTDPPALATIDLSEPPETPAAAAGRIIGGLVLMLVGGVAALAFFAAYLIGWAIPATADISELLGEVQLYIAIGAFALAVVGFEVLRRGRKTRAQEAAEAAEIMSRLKSEGALEPPPSPTTGAETHL